MNRSSSLTSVLRCAVVALVLAAAGLAQAFPPALPHTIYGMARDEYGNPLRTNATIILTTSAGVSVSCVVDPEDEPGVNFRLTVPLDSGVKSDIYKNGVLQPAVPFRIRVSINNATFLPLEMAGDYSLLGQPGKKTRIDLTLGEDTNGNGLPDAWERAIIAARGWNLGLNGLDANSSPGKNGVSLLQEYVAGTYGFEDGNGLNLAIARVESGTPVLEFLAVRGRTYTIVGSASLKTWAPIPFRVLLPDGGGESVSSYLSTEVRLLQVAVPAPATGAAPLFYKLQIQ